MDHMHSNSRSSHLLDYHFNSSFVKPEINTDDSDIEEIEVEPNLRPPKGNQLVSTKETVSSVSSCNNSDVSTSIKSSAISSSADVIKEAQNEKTAALYIDAASASEDLAEKNNNELQERRRTAYSFCSSSLSEAVISPTLKSPMDHNHPNSTRLKSSLKNEESATSGFCCNICFDTASNPVLTLCGHLFCWPCLHRWLVNQSRNPLCPVCKAGCGKDKVIPVYGRGSEEKDPRSSDSIPDRPKGQRPKPQPSQSYGGWGRVFGMGTDIGGDGALPFNMHAGLSFFPTLTFQYTPEHGAQFHTNAGSPQQAFLFRLFFMLGILVFLANILG